MTAKREYRDREDVQVAVLDALVERGMEGMTVLELRASVDADIDDIERALTALKEDGLIGVEDDDGSTLIKPDDRVIPSGEEEGEDESFGDWLRERLPF